MINNNSKSKLNKRSLKIKTVDKDYEIVYKDINFALELQKNNLEVRRMAKICEKNNKINKSLYTKLNVMSGLRDQTGKGVLAGLTNISDIQARKIVDGKEVPCDGNLYYRGYNIKDIVDDFTSRDVFGFEETAYLILFGELPTKKELIEFRKTIAIRRDLPPNFVRDVILKAPTSDMMNNLARCVLMLYAYDPNPDNTSIANVLRQSLNMIARFPRLMVYGYHAYKNRNLGEDLFIYAPKPEYSTAENILYMLRPDKKFSDIEAKVLDMALVLHMDHGGGNNSTFTTHVVTSSGTDTYSTIAAAIGSLKGPKHGGANRKVVEMFDDMKKTVKNWKSEEEVSRYLENLLDKKAFDKMGLIYGMGHAVYSVSDPRAVILKSHVKSLAKARGYEKEFALYELVEKLAPEVIAKKRNMYKGVNANVDFYSGLIYNMLDLPTELYTPIFATARIVGWCAHRLEELQNSNKITRPAFKPAIKIREYVPFKERKS